MNTWIAQLLAQAIGPIKDAIQAVYERIATIYSSVITVGSNVRNAFGTLLATVRLKLARLRSLTTQVYATAWWIIFVRIPQSISNATQSIVSWAARTINDLRIEARTLISNVIAWARQQLNDLTVWRDKFVTWLLGRLSDIWHDLQFVFDRVTQLLIHPEALAAWILGPLFMLALQYIQLNLDQILDFIVKRGVYYAARAALQIEDVLVKLL